MEPVRMSFKFQTKLPPLNFPYSSKSEVDLVGFAWDCAHNTYKTKPRKASQPPIDSGHEPQMRFQNTTPAIEGNYDKDLYTVREEEVRQDCFAGTVKAITATVIKRTGSDDINELMPVLVISIRGSASKMDHIVNANSDPKNAGSYIVGYFCSLSRSKHSSASFTGLYPITCASLMMVARYERHQSPLRIFKQRPGSRLSSGQND